MPPTRGAKRWLIDCYWVVIAADMPSDPESHAQYKNRNRIKPINNHGMSVQYPALCFILSLLFSLYKTMYFFCGSIEGADLYLTPSSKLVDARKNGDEWDKDLARGNWQNGNNPNVFLISVNLSLYGFPIYSTNYLLRHWGGLINATGRGKRKEGLSQDIVSDGLERHRHRNATQGWSINTLQDNSHLQSILIGKIRTFLIYYGERKSLSQNPNMKSRVQEGLTHLFSLRHPRYYLEGNPFASSS